MEIDDTFSEGFDIYCSRVIITGDKIKWARFAALSSVGFATSIIFCPAEAGVDIEARGPDGRDGLAIILSHISKKKLKAQLLERLSQCVLPCPTTAVFDGLEKNGDTLPIGKLISYFGDGFESVTRKYGRKLYEIPIMGGTFLIESDFTVSKGVSANIWIFAKDWKAGLKGCEQAVSAVSNVKNVITPFPGGVCASGSKIKAIKYPFLKASTNHYYCPSLNDKVDSKLPPGTQAVYEIIFNGISLGDVKKGMKVAIEELKELSGVIKISAGNYGGKLGKHKIYLHEL